MTKKNIHFLQSIFISCIIIFTNILHAHCPNELIINQEDGSTASYCLEINWKNGESKIRGEFSETHVKSPYLNPLLDNNGNTLSPRLWIYSTMTIYIWEKNDDEHKPVRIKDFRIFPYMIMEDGVHHMASYNFTEKKQNNPSQYSYKLSQLALNEMSGDISGCWTLRWSIKKNVADNDIYDIKSSHFLSTINNFLNISESQNNEQNKICEELVEASLTGFEIHDH